MEFKKVLLIDDAPEMGRLVKMALRKKPEIEFTHVTNGAEGIQAIEANSPDLVLLDFMLEAESGLDVVAAMKKKWNQLPVIIFFTGASDEKAIQEMKATGAKGRIEKPFSPATLVDSLQKILQEPWA